MKSAGHAIAMYGEDAAITAARPRALQTSSTRFVIAIGSSLSTDFIS